MAGFYVSSWAVLFLLTCEFWLRPCPVIRVCFLNVPGRYVFMNIGNAATYK